jgi:hypothetical protein
MYYESRQPALTHLGTTCTAERCLGCADALRQEATSGRWFITMGHPGFNLPANNRAGYATHSLAARALRRCAGARAG